VVMFLLPYAAAAAVVVAIILMDARLYSHLRRTAGTAGTETKRVFYVRTRVFRLIDKLAAEFRIREYRLYIARAHPHTRFGGTRKKLASSVALSLSASSNEPPRIPRGRD